MFKDIPKQESHGVIMDNVMFVSTKTEHKQGLENLFKASITFSLHISPH